MCGCAWQPLCQWCKRVLHSCREVVVPYAGKRYHLSCWHNLERVARQTGGRL